MVACDSVSSKSRLLQSLPTVHLLDLCEVKTERNAGAADLGIAQHA